MEEPDIKRKLATILVADIVGYSRLTANDEDWTIRALGDFRKIVDGIVARHDGRIFSTGGDSVLAEFASPVEAVRCAVDFQEASRSRNLLQPRDRQLRYRIGINLGDVMVRGTDLLGDGVNVAARLEGLAEPGGICVSGSVWDQIDGKLSIGYVDIGEQSVKNIPRPVRAYHLRIDGGSGEAVELAAPATAAAGPAAGSPANRIGWMPGMLIGAGAIIVALAAVIVWQFWPKTNGPIAPVAMAPIPPPTPPAASALETSLAARLAVLAPGMSEKSRTENARDFPTWFEHKALAVSQQPPGTWLARDRPSAQDAGDSALEDCQIYFGQPCVLAIVDSTLEPMPADGKWVVRDMPRTRYAGDFDPAQIPGIVPSVRERADIVGYRAAASPKAASFHPIQSGFFVVTGAADQHTAEVEALKLCTDDLKGRSLAGRCFLYASDNRVVLPQRLRAPLTPQAAVPQAPTLPPAASVAPVPSPGAAPAPQPARPQNTAGATAPKTFRDCPDCPEMVAIPAGTFQMGATADENAHFEVPTTEARRDQPQHAVSFARPFALAKFDVTRAEFAAFAKAANFRPRAGCMTVANGNWRPQADANWENPGIANGENDPAVCMNETEIGAYLGWLKQTTGKAYRLPSEAEWEYAARGGTTTPYYWGDDPKDACTYENVGDESFKEKMNGKNPVMPCRDGFAQLAPVGSFKPNPFGLYDMLGNVFVLTADCWNETYDGAPTDGSAWMSGDCTRHPARKGTFGSIRPWMFRAANRIAEGNVVRRNRVGFRVALSLP